MRSTCRVVGCGLPVAISEDGKTAFHVTKAQLLIVVDGHAAKADDVDRTARVQNRAPRPATRPRSSLDYSFVNKTKASEAYRVDGKKKSGYGPYQPPTS